MKKVSKFLLMAVAIVIVFASCSRVAPNYQGVLMQDWGKNGKTDFSLVKGRVWTITPGTELFQVPLWEQRADFEDRTLHLKAADNTEFSSRPTYTYSVIEDRAVDVVFSNKQLDSGDEFMRALENNILETKIYDIMKEVSRGYITDELMATGGSLKYEKAVEKRVKEEFAKRGLTLINFSSQLEFSKKVTEKIDNRNEVNTNITVLDQQIDEQIKRNELAELKAQEQIIKSKGLTPQILEAMAIDKWDGSVPSTMGGGNVPLIKSIK
jgi:hypothetical protein